MSAPSKLFLDYNSFAENWTVLDSNRFAFGMGNTPEDAIRSARVVSDAPIYANEEFKGIIDEVLDVPVKEVSDLSECDTIYSKDELIECLAELGGFNIAKVYDERNFLLGYTMELKE